MKTAFISGVNGQIGSYMAEFLLAKGYAVHGLIRRSSSFNTGRIDHLYQEPWEPGCRFFLHHGDVTDAARMQELVNKIKPDEVYHFAAQSHVKISFEGPAYSVETCVMGTLNLLEACRALRDSTGRVVKFYNSASSEMFGSSHPPQNEDTPFKPQSPYACAKVYTFHQTISYREAYGLFACNGITFNNESPRRGETFATRKITRAAARIKLGLQSELRLGNMDAKRDWGFTGDYVEAMWLMMQQDKPDDYVIATGKSYSVRDFCVAVFDDLGLNPEKHIIIDQRLFRPSEVNHLQGDRLKLEWKTNWSPKINFYQLVTMMVESDMKLAEQELLLKGAGR